jgi:dTDP-4-dehydrorhamnose 3,5-epimerase
MNEDISLSFGTTGYRIRWDMKSGLFRTIFRSRGQVLQGEVLDVVVDLRRKSSTFGKWRAVALSDENKVQMFIPPGLAHGFLVRSEAALFHYKCTEFYYPEDEICLRWDDPEIGIQWEIEKPNISGKDARGLRLREIPADRLFS